MPDMIISVQPDPMAGEFKRKGMVMGKDGELVEPKKKVLKPGQDIETDDMYDLEEYIPVFEQFLKTLKASCGYDKKENMTEEKDGMQKEEA